MWSPSMAQLGLNRVTPDHERSYRPGYMIRLDKYALLDSDVVALDHHGDSMAAIA